MSRKQDLQAAAAGALAEMKQTPAQRMAQQAAQDPEPASATGGRKRRTENTAPFTIWTTPENVRRWKAYQKAKKDTLKTQNDFIVAAVTEYIKAHPVTDAEKAALIKSLEL